MVNSFPSHLAFCKLCLFRVQWLTHSCHVITSWLTIQRLTDCTGNETCREEAASGKSLLKGYPHTKKTLYTPFPSLFLPSSNIHYDHRHFWKLLHLPTAFHSFSVCLSILFFHATPLWLCMVLMHSKWWEMHSALLHYCSCCGLCSFCSCNLQQSTPSYWDARGESWNERGIADKYRICSLAAACVYENADWHSAATSMLEPDVWT